MKKCLVLCSLLLLVNPLRAEIYKWVDSDGNVHFTDKPTPGAETITLPPIKTYSSDSNSPTTPPITEFAQSKETKEEIVSYDDVKIVSPHDQETIRNNQGLLNVLVAVDPALQEGHKVQLFYDSAALGKPQSEMTFALKNINRGSHTLSVQVLNESGEVLGKSPVITFFMHQARVGGHS